MTDEKEKWGYVVFAISPKMINASLDAQSSGGYVMASSYDEAYGMASRIADKFCKPSYTIRSIHLLSPDLSPIRDVSEAVMSPGG